MKNRFFIFLVFFMLSCGGGSSGTSVGTSGGGGTTNFSGVVVSRDGSGISFTPIVLLNTEDATVTDEAGAFEINARFPGGDAAFSIGTSERASVIVVVEDLPEQTPDVELSILFDSIEQSASLLSVTLRARIVRSCSPFFLNTRTIRQTAPIAEGIVCTVEVEMKSNGVSIDNLLFELQHRGCSADDPWQFGAVGKTGTSGPGTGEIDFTFRNDERHCVSRIIGPLRSDGEIPLSAQIHSLRKQQFDLS